jgi:hypothetical protein
VAGKNSSAVFAQISYSQLLLFPCPKDAKGQRGTKKISSNQCESESQFLNHKDAKNTKQHKVKSTSARWAIPPREGNWKLHDYVPTNKVNLEFGKC